MTPNSCKSIFFSCLWSLLPGQHKKLWCPQSATAERVKVSQTTASISSLQKCPVPRVGSVYENLLRSFNVCNLISCRKASVGGVSAEPDRTRAISFSRLLVHVQSSSTELIATGLFPPHTPSHSPFAVKIQGVIILLPGPQEMGWSHNLEQVPFFLCTSGPLLVKFWRKDALMTWLLPYWFPSWPWESHLTFAGLHLPWNGEEIIRRLRSLCCHHQY